MRIFSSGKKILRVNLFPWVVRVATLSTIDGISEKAVYFQKILMILTQKSLIQVHV